MKTWRRRLSRPEAVLVAAALLLPIPLFAQSGLSVPLPGVVERGLGSLVTVDATDERSETSATGRASENGTGDRRSARTSLRISRSAGLSPVLRGETQTGSGSGGSPESGTPAGDDRESGTAPAEGEPEGDGGGGAGSPGDPSRPERPRGRVRERFRERHEIRVRQPDRRERHRPRSRRGSRRLCGDRRARRRRRG